MSLTNLLSWKLSRKTKNGKKDHQVLLLSIGLTLSALLVQNGKYLLFN